MSVLIESHRTPVPTGAAWWSWWRRWRGPWAYALVFGLIVSAPALVSSFDLEGVSITWPLLATQLIGPQITAHLVLLAWAIATRHPVSGRDRTVRIALCVAVALAIDAIVSPWLLYTMLHLPSVYEVALSAKGMAMPPAWLLACGEYLASALFAALAIVLGEHWRVRSDAVAALRQMDASGAELRHGLIEARLAAMQAQVEPQFLFETLVHVEAAYESDAARAALALDRLIAFLRLALPGLRGGGQAMGSTFAAELALVRAYLAVIEVRSDAPVTLRVDADPACNDARLYPMLLLPLVQAALRSAAVGSEATMRVRCMGNDEVGVEIAFAGTAMSGDDPEVARVRERLDALYDARAFIEVKTIAPQTTQIALRLPRHA